MKRSLILSNPEARRRAIEAIQEAPDGHCVVISEPRRNSAQNARLWASLTDISRQVEWYGRMLTPEDWKVVFTASLKRMEVVPNLDQTGFVALGQSTSRMSKREISDLLELIYAFGAERYVTFGDEHGQ